MEKELLLEVYGLKAIFKLSSLKMISPMKATLRTSGMRNRRSIDLFAIVIHN